MDNQKELKMCHGCREEFDPRYLFIAHDGFGILCGSCYREYKEGLIGDMEQNDSD